MTPTTPYDDPYKILAEDNQIVNAVRDLIRRSNVSKGESAGEEDSEDSLNVNNDLRSLAYNAILTSSGDTLTLSPVSSGVMPLYGDDGDGWSRPTLKADITLDTTGYTNGMLYDVFYFSDQSQDDPTLAFYTVIWASDTVRTATLTLQDGVPLLESDTHYRYLTTGRYNGSCLLVPSTDESGTWLWGTGDKQFPTGSDPVTGTLINQSGLHGYSAGVLKTELNSITGLLRAVDAYIEGEVHIGADSDAGGWSIDATSLYSAHAVLSSAGEYISLGDTPPTSYSDNVGAFLEGANGGRLSLYKDADNYLKWDNSKLLIKTEGVTVAGDGLLVANNPTISIASGAVTADSGGLHVLMPSTAPDATRSYKFDSADFSVNYGGIEGWITDTVNTIRPIAKATPGLDSLLNMSAVSDLTYNAKILFGVDDGSGAFPQPSMEISSSNGSALMNVVGIGSVGYYYTGDFGLNGASATLSLTGDYELDSANVIVSPASGGIVLFNNPHRNVDFAVYGQSNANPVLYVDASTKRFGIGTDSPSVKLDVIGQVRAETGFDANSSAIVNVLDPTSPQDAATKAYADALVVGLWDDRGNFDASVNAYPSSGGSGAAGAILKGDIWTVSVAGTLPTSQGVEVGDTVRALINTPGNTQANWAIQQNNIMLPVSSVNGGTGNNNSVGLLLTTNQGTLSFGAASKTLAVNKSLTLDGTDGKNLTLTGSLSVGADTSITGGGAIALGGFTAAFGGDIGFPAAGAIGDLLYGSSTTAFSRLADVAAGQPLISGGVGTAFSWAGYTFSATAAKTYTFPVNSATLPGLGELNVFSVLNTFTNLKLSTGLVYPSSDSTTALRITKADATTSVMTFDTTNIFTGIGAGTPTAKLNIFGGGRDTSLYIKNLQPGVYFEQTGTTPADTKWNIFPHSATGSFCVYEETTSLSGYRFAINPAGEIGLGGSITNTSTMAGATFVVKSTGFGIGTSSPTNTSLEINRAISAGNFNGGVSSIALSSSADSDKILAFGFETDNNYGFIQTIERSPLAFGTYHLALQPKGGKVGVGTASPSALVDVVGSADVQQLTAKGHTTQAVGTPIAQFTRNDTAAGVSSMLGLTALGGGAAGDGGSVGMFGKSSTTAAQSMALIDWRWITATHASRAAALRLYAYDTAARLGIEIEASGSAAKLAFYGGVTAARGAALTAQLTTITHTAPGTPDYAIQDFTQTSPWGFADHDEANSVLKVIANLQTRVAELEARLGSATGVNLFA